VTDLDFAEIGDHEKRLLFVALTRARLHAILVTSDRAAQALRARLV
jgi:ATP-dependent exoDNAse (exonuclease V) beta subunit